MRVHLHGQDRNGNWLPVSIDEHGGVGGSSGVPDSDAWRYVAIAGGTVDSADVVLRAAAGIGLSAYLKQIQIMNSHATVETEVVIKDGATVIWRMAAPAAMKVPMVIEFDDPLFSSGNTALNIACVTTGTKTYFNAQGFIAETRELTFANFTLLEEIFDDLGVLMQAPDGSTLTLN